MLPQVIQMACTIWPPHADSTMTLVNWSIMSQDAGQLNAWTLLSRCWTQTR